MLCVEDGGQSAGGRAALSRLVVGAALPVSCLQAAMDRLVLSLVFHWGCGLGCGRVRWIRDGGRQSCSACKGRAGRNMCGGLGWAALSHGRRVGVWGRRAIRTTQVSGACSGQRSDGGSIGVTLRGREGGGIGGLTTSSRR
jgi:hypothetical protein